MNQNKHVQARKPVGIWIRVSTEDQAKGESPKHHEKRARFYADSKEWDIREVYHLEAVSGKSVMDHPEARRMLKDIERGHITGLIFSKLARLARNTKELLEFAEIFRNHDADLISLQESIDTSTPAGRLFYTMIAAMAQWEREEIADRVAASIVIRAKLGKPIGKAPFGYRLKDKRLVPDPNEAPIRRLAYELFAEHQRKKTVARLLNDHGYRTRNGSLFTDTTVEHLIRNPTAKGMHRANYTTNRSGKERVLKPESEWVWFPVEPIVSEDLWNKCNDILMDRRRRFRRPGRRPRHLFAGITYCECGAKMYVRSNCPKYLCQKCNNKIPIVDLDAIFYEQLKGFFLSPQQISQELALADENLVQKNQLLRTLRGEQEKLQDEITRIYRLYNDNQISPEGFGKFYKPLEERQKQLDDEIPRLQAELDLLQVNNLSADSVLNEAKDLYSRWPSLNREEKRKIVESVTERITVGKGDIAINLCYLPSSEEMTKWQRSLLSN